MSSENGEKEVAPSATRVDGAIGKAMSSSARRGRVLIVDDQEALAGAIVRVLEGTHDVRAVTKAKDALGLFAAGERFDVVISDLMMPELNGMDFYEQLLKTAPDQAGKMIFMTGGAFTDRAASFIARFPERVVSKPLDLLALRRLVEQHLT